VLSSHIEADLGHLQQAGLKGVGDSALNVGFTSDVVDWIVEAGLRRLSFWINNTYR